MILQSLCGYYDRLADDPNSNVPLQGYARVGISSCIVINNDGCVVSIRSLCNKEGKKLKTTPLIVPELPKRSGSKPSPAFLCENPEFIFGIYKKPEGAEYRFKASCSIHNSILGETNDGGACAILKFFAKRTQGRYDIYGVDASPLDDGGYVIFQLQGDDCYLHERPAIKRAWEQYKKGQSIESQIGQCLVTGEVGPIARIHNNVGGFGQDKPTLVGFNQNSFESYQKKQGMNAPVSETAAFKYTTALNSLLSDRLHSVNLHSDKILFWAERESPVEEVIAALVLSSNFEIEESGLDETSTALVRGVLHSLFSGKMPESTQIDKDVRFYILGLSASKTRLVVRFFYTDTFGEILERITQHHQDISLIGLENPSLYRILSETAVGRESSNVQPNLNGMLMQSILKGTSYPYSLYQAMLRRIRAEGGKDPQKAKGYPINAVRVGMIKGYLNRTYRLNEKKEMMEVALNEEERNIGYLLGRLFAMLEKAQKDALGKVNASIVDKYLNSALATPQMVFPMLLALSKKHISKADNWYMDKQITGVVNLLPSSGFPISLNAEQQGTFLIGYYHQNQALYTKREKDNKTKDNKEMEVL